MTLTRPVFESVVGAGAMINWITVARDHLPIYEDWYNFQHLPERVSTPGFLRARRFRAADHADTDSCDFLTVYETTDVDVLASPEYLRRLDNPTDLTLEVVPLFAEFRRAACRVTVARGHGSSGRVVALEIESDAEPERLRDALGAEVFASLIGEHHLVAASLYEPDLAVSDAKNATAEGRSSDQQQAAASVVLAELHTGADTARVVDELVARAARSGVTIRPVAPQRTFTLIYELRSTSLDQEPA
ncbi:hypothetical protein BCA37_22240 [Mycobacterium sp. djl-10]|nr:hypothetical protein BCA37_22240 [Mycobacterium sp. djl-10]